MSAGDPRSLLRTVSPESSVLKVLSVFKLQASETLRSNTHSSTATELLHVKQQVMAQQQQLEEQDRLLKDHQKKEEEFKIKITVLQEKIKVCEMVRISASFGIFFFMCLKHMN